MKADRFNRLRELFEAVMQFDDEESRRDYIAAACGDDRELRQELESLISSSECVDDDSDPMSDQQLDEQRIALDRMLDVPADADGMPGRPTSGGRAGIPGQIGAYRIRRVIASGGMGTVYEAVQENPRRAVAIKVMKHGIATRSALRRFAYESQLLARLRHPGIAQVYEAGTHQDGGGTVPYFAMEYIVGARSLTDYAREKQLGTRDRLQLFSRACEAVHHGHQKGVIHRDLKPNNILVDAIGHVKIIDFGVARSTDSDVAITTMQTDVGQLIGTLQYMSPEQVAADPHDIDTRSDVYSLGVVLYELLTGHGPYDLTRTAIHEATRIIREQDPTRLSAHDARLRGDVETIALKALAKDRDRRYMSASAFMADIDRYLNNEAIAARPASAVYQAKKLISRHRLAFAFLAALFVLISGFGLCMSVMYARAEALRLKAIASAEAEQEQRKLAEARAHELRTITDFQQSMLGNINAETMGRRIVRALRQPIRKSMEKDGAGPEEVDAMLAFFDKLVAEVNPTSLALDTVYEDVLTRATEAVDKRFANQPLTRASLQIAIAQTYRNIGRFEPALRLLQSCVGTRREHLGNDHVSTLDAVNAVGVVLLEMGRHADAEKYIRESLENRRRVLGDGHPSTIESINNMSGVLSNRGMVAEAEPFLIEALEISRRVLGDDHPRTLLTLANLAGLKQRLGDLKAAEGYAREALDGSRRIMGEDHPDTLASIGQMGAILSAQDKHDDALPYFVEALEGSRRVLGDDHPETLARLGQMGMLLQSRDKHEDAEQYLRMALERSRRVLGSKHPLTIDFIVNLGVVLNDLGKHPEAETLFEESLKTRRRTLGPDHPRTLESINKLADFLQQMGRFRDAEPLFREALSAHRRVDGDDHAQTSMAQGRVGAVLLDLKEYHEAEVLFRNGLRLARRDLAEDKRMTLFLTGLAESLYKLDRFQEAESLFLEAHQIIASSDVEQDRIRELRRKMVEFYDAWDDASPNQGYASKAGTWRSKLTADAVGDHE